VRLASLEKKARNGKERNNREEAGKNKEKRDSSLRSE
jgi:hypothetical protein